MQPFCPQAPLAPPPRTFTLPGWVVALLSYLLFAGFMGLVAVISPVTDVVIYGLTLVNGGLLYLLSLCADNPPEHKATDGVRLFPQEAPELFAYIEAARAALNAPAADIVVINGAANAYAVQYLDYPERGQTLRVLKIGVVYLFILTRAQLKTTLLHEFTHFHHADSEAQVWTSAAALASQRNEHRADASVIPLGFKQVAAESLTSKHVFAHYLDRHYWPTVMPPTSLDFTTRPWTRMEQWLLRRLRRMTPETWLAAALAEELIAEDSALAARYRAENTPYNTHPTLTQRLAALGEPPRFAPPTPEQRAWLLLPPALRAPVLDALDREWSQHNHQAP